MTSQQYTTWRKSRRSDGNGNCVEVAHAADGTIGVRDSKDPTGPILAFDPATWRTFTSHIQAGGFNPEQPST